MPNLENIFTPESLSEASSFLQTHGDEAKVVGAGTDLLLSLGSTRFLVSLSRVGLNYIKTDNKSIIIGSMTAIADIANDTLLNEQPYSILKTAARLFGTRQIRNRATIGGNICSAVPSADMPVPLVALDAKAVVYGSEGERTVSLEDFIVDYRRVDLRKGEMLKEIQIPLLGTGSRGSFSKVGRTSVDIALVNCSVRTDSTPSDFRIVLGAVGPTPIRATRAERFLKQSGVLNKTQFSQVARLAAEETKPIGDIRASSEYRRAMSELLVYRSLMQIASL